MTQVQAAHLAQPVVVGAVAGVVHLVKANNDGVANTVGLRSGHGSAVRTEGAFDTSTGRQQTQSKRADAYAACIRPRSRRNGDTSATRSGDEAEELRSGGRRTGTRTWSTDTTLPVSLNQYDSGRSTFT